MVELRLPRILGHQNQPRPFGFVSSATPVAAADDADAAAEDTPAVLLATADEAPEDVEFDELAPVAAIRCSRSACVVHAMLVPSELTRGRAAQLR